MKYNDEIELQAHPIDQDEKLEEQEDLFQTEYTDNKEYTEEKKYLIVLLLLFFVQGIPLGFIGALSLLLAKYGSSMNEQAALSMAFYPYSFKLILAPFLDTIYTDKIGKRRSYILPCQYLLGFSYLLLGLCSLDKMIQEHEILFLTFSAFLMVMLSAIQDIAVDGWVLTCLSEKCVHLGSTCQAIGQQIGIIFGSVLFINITSKEFSKQLFGQGANVILTTSQFCYVTAGIIFGITVLVQLITREKPQKKKSDDGKNPCQLIYQLLVDLKDLFKNKNMRTYVIFLLVRGIAGAPVNASSGIKLIQEGGFPKEVLSQIGLFTFPFSAITACVVGKYLPRGQESRLMMLGFWLLFLDSVASYLIVANISELGGYNNNTLWLVIGESVYSQIVSTFFFCCSGGFMMRISDANVGGSYLTMLASASNFGGQGSSSLGLLALDYFPYNYTSFAFWIIGCGLILAMRKPLHQIEKADLDTWKISHQKD